MPFRHPAPWRARTHVAEFKSRTWRMGVILPTAILLFASWLIAEALDIQGGDLWLLTLVVFIAFLILLLALRFFRSELFSRGLEKRP